MSLDDIPAGTIVFLDSTILHYAWVQFEPATPQCIRLLDRIRRGDVQACLNFSVVHDAVHKVMCSEVVQRFGRPRAGLIAWMKRNPDSIKGLSQASELLKLVAALPIRMLPADLDSLVAAQQAVPTHGLLANDALLVALMESHEIVDLATNDDDFDRVPGLKVWKPR